METFAFLYFLDATGQQSAVHRYGEKRKITQTFQEGEDARAVTGRAWHWQPPIADDVYEGNK